MTYSLLLTGASGVGKSTLMRGALETFGSGIVVAAPGDDELDSYVGLEGPNFAFKGFDDPFFHPELKEFEATGHGEMIKWLKELYLSIKDGKSKYAVLAVDTQSAIGRLAYNATMAKFKRTEPPPAQSPDGAAFYSYLRITQESGVRAMRALRGLGLHWLAATHPTEAETTAIQQTQGAPSGSKIMPDLPGGFKNQFPAYFTTVLDVNVGVGGKRFVRWDDPKRVIKSRFGSLGAGGKIELPSDARGAWQAVAGGIDAARERLVKGVK